MKPTFWWEWKFVYWNSDALALCFKFISVASPVPLLSRAQIPVLGLFWHPFRSSTWLPRPEMGEWSYLRGISVHSGWFSRVSHPVSWAFLSPFKHVCKLCWSQFLEIIFISLDAGRENRKAHANLGTGLARPQCFGLVPDRWQVPQLPGSVTH